MNAGKAAPPLRWRTPEDVVAIGCSRARVVMMNEAHNGLLRSARTRRVGMQVLPAAHAAGVGRVAMEALYPEFAAPANETRAVPDAPGGYLSQSELRELIAAALALEWTLVPYEADFVSQPPGLARWSTEETNWREDQQARNLFAALERLPDAEKLLVWCGNGHLTKHAIGGWQPMAVRFRELSGIDPFVVDQTQSVEFVGGRPAVAAPWVDAYRDEIAGLGGTAGFLSAEAPAGWPAARHADAYLVSLDNELS